MYPNYSVVFVRGENLEGSKFPKGKKNKMYNLEGFLVKLAFLPERNYLLSIKLIA